METIDAFVQVFEGLGYSKCGAGDHENGFEKIAIYADASGKPQHAAREIGSGDWVSKLGTSQDIEHKSPFGVSGNTYGNPVVYMRRALPTSPVTGRTP